MSATRAVLSVLGFVAAFSATAPGRLGAQAASDRRAIFRLRDSLGTVTDTMQLLQVEARSMDSARTHRDDPLIHLRLGFVGLRLAALTNSPSHLRDSEGEFEWASQLSPTWPVPWYGLGRAELLEADLFPTGLRGLFQVLGHDVYDAVARDIATSAAVDSTFTMGVVQLTEDALLHGMPAHLVTALSAMRRVAHAPAARDPLVLLMRGRIERETGDVDSAIVAFQMLLNHNRYNPLALFELGRTKLVAGRIGGVDQWYLGLALADSATAALYRADLRLVMSDSALRVFDAARGQGRVTVAQRFWDTRDAEAINSSAERLREHYRRIDYARRNYPLLPPGHRYDSVRAFDATGSLFDDRGRIYVRHGDPDDRTSYSMTGIPPNESWLYRRPGGDLLFHFAQPDSAQGYRMYESLLDIVGLGIAARTTGQGDVRGRLEGGSVLATYGAGWTAQAAEEMLHSRTRLSPIYSRMLSAGEAGAKAMQLGERSAGRKSIAVGLQTDSWKFGFELPMSADVDVVAVGSDTAGTQLQVVFAIPGTSLYAAPTTGTVIYPIRMRVAVRTAAGELVTSVDTLRNFGAPTAIPETGTLFGRLPLSVPPGNYVVRVALETQSRGLITKPQSVQVAALGTATITLSDLALGARSVRLPWRVGSADTAWINPQQRFHQTEPMQLYFEVGGVAAGAGYRGELAVMKAGQRNAQMQVGFAAVAASRPDRIRREIDLGRLGAGDYVMQVTVSTPDGGKAVRQRRFTVIK